MLWRIMFWILSEFHASVHLPSGRFIPRPQRYTRWRHASKLKHISIRESTIMIVLMLTNSASPSACFCCCLGCCRRFSCGCCCCCPCCSGTPGDLSQRPYIYNTQHPLAHIWPASVFNDLWIGHMCDGVDQRDSEPAGGLTTGQLSLTVSECYHCFGRCKREMQNAFERQHQSSGQVQTTLHDCRALLYTTCRIGDWISRVEFYPL